MNWEEKQQLAALLNNGQYEQAVSVLQQQEKWDVQDVEIFVEGFNLREFSLCEVIKERLLKFEGHRMTWKAALRLETLKIKLSNNEQ